MENLNNNTTATNSKTEKKLQKLNAMIAKHPQNATLYLKRAELVSKEEALKDLNKAIELEPNNAEYYHARSRYQKEYHNALADLDNAIMLQPDNAWYYYSRANFLIDEMEDNYLEKKQSDLARATAFADQDCKVFFVNQYALFCERELCNYDFAISHYLELMDLKTDNRFSSRILSKISSLCNEIPDSLLKINFINKAIELGSKLNPTDDIRISLEELSYSRGKAFILFGNLQQAIDEFTALIEDKCTRQKYRYYKLRAKCYLFNQNPDKAYADIETIFNEFEVTSSDYDLKAEYYIYIADFQEAVSELKKSIEIQSDKYLLVKRAYCYCCLDKAKYAQEILVDVINSGEQLTLAKDERTRNVLSAVNEILTVCTFEKMLSYLMTFTTNSTISSNFIDYAKSIDNLSFDKSNLPNDFCILYKKMFPESFKTHDTSMDLANTLQNDEIKMINDEYCSGNKQTWLIKEKIRLINKIMENLIQDFDASIDLNESNLNNYISTEDLYDEWRNPSSSENYYLGDAYPEVRSLADKLINDAKRHNRDLDSLRKFISGLTIELAKIQEAEKANAILEARLAERNEIIARLSHSIKNLIRSAVIDPLTYMQQTHTLNEKNLTEALKGANLIREIANGMNLSFKGSLADFEFDAANTGFEPHALSAMFTDGLKYAVSNMLDGKYFNVFMRQYFGGRKSYDAALTEWNLIGAAATTAELIDYINRHLTAFELSITAADNLVIGNEKGSAIKLLIMFQEIIFNAIKYTAFVPKSERHIVIRLTAENGIINFSVNNSCNPEVQAKSSGLGSVIIDNFSKLLAGELKIDKSSNWFNLSLTFPDLWHKSDK